MLCTYPLPPLTPPPSLHLLRTTRLCDEKSTCEGRTETLVMYGIERIKAWDEHVHK